MDASCVIRLANPIALVKPDDVPDAALFKSRVFVRNIRTNLFPELSSFSGRGFSAFLQLRESIRKTRMTMFTRKGCCIQALRRSAFETRVTDEP